MASLTLSMPYVFPPGTSLGVYSATGRTTVPVGTPPDLPVAIATMGNETVTFHGLVEGTDYYIAGDIGGGRWRYVLAATGPIDEADDTTEVNLGDLAGTVQLPCSGRRNLYVRGQLVGNTTINLAELDQGPSTIVLLRLTQDATGGRTVAFTADDGTGSIPVRTDGTSPMMPTTAGAFRYFQAISNQGASVDVWALPDTA